MKRLIIIALSIVIAISIALLPVSSVGAAPKKMQVSGNFELALYEPYKILESGPNIILFVEMGANWAGDLLGSDIGKGIEVDRVDGKYVFNTKTVWEGSIDGKYGRVQITTASRGLYGPDPGPPLWMTGTMILTGLSGELEGIHGRLTFRTPYVIPPDPYPIGYSGWIMFDK